MNDHGIFAHLVCSSTLGDGGPRAWRRRHRAQDELPEKFLPGRFLAARRPEVRAAIVELVNNGGSPAPWFLRRVVESDEIQLAVPPLPVDRRWTRHGRWSTKAVTARG